MRLALLGLALLVSGCTSGPSPEAQPLAAEGDPSFLVSAGSPQTLYLSVVERGPVTLAVDVEAGAFAGLVLSGPCDVEVLAGAQESASKECGELEPGLYRLEVSVQAGVARGHVGALGGQVERPRDG